MPDLDTALATITRFAERPPIARPPDEDVARRARSLRRKRRIRRSSAAALVVVVGVAGVAVGLRAGGDDGARSVVSDTPPTTRTVEPGEFLDEVIDIIEAEAYDADPDWVAGWREQAVAVAATARTAGETYRFIEGMRGMVGPGPTIVSPPPVQHQADDRTAPSPAPTSEVVGDVGFLTLPPIPSGATSESGTAYIATAHDLLDADVCGWIVDLRVPEPVRSASDLGTMLSAVAPLLGPGTTVGYRDRTGATTTWDIGEDGAVSFGEEEVAPGSDEAMGPDLPVAVLQRWSTSGTWEALLMALRGEPDVRTFGLPSGGRSTGTETFTLSDGSLLVLRTSLPVDRNGTGYDGPIAPDEQVAPRGTRTDPQREAAAAWLATQPSCR